jgi:hypothetical protein
MKRAVSDEDSLPLGYCSKPPPARRPAANGGTQDAAVLPQIA